MLIYKKKYSFFETIKLNIHFKFILIFFLLFFIILSSFILGGQSYKMGYLSTLKNKYHAAPKKLKNEFFSFISKDDKLFIDIDFKNYNKIITTRVRNIENGRIGIYTDEDWANAKIKYKSKDYKVKIRLKGVYDDHWHKGLAWSYKVQTKNNDILFGNNEFSLQTPSTRSNLFEIVFMKMLERENIIFHRNHLVEVIINGENNGLYFVEDHYTKYLIENNNRREGPIIGYNKDSYVESLSRGKDSVFITNTIDDAFYKAGLKMQNKKIYEKNKAFLKLAETGLKKLELFRQGILSTSEVFEVEMLAKTMAISALLGSGQFDWRDIKFYVNPFTLKLEPIVREVHPDFQGFWWLTKDQSAFNKLLFNDEVFYKRYIDSLKYVSDPKYLSKFIIENKKYISNLESKLNLFTDYTFTFDEIINQANVIRESLKPPSLIHSYLDKVDQNNIFISFSNIQPYKIKIDCIYYLDLKINCPTNNIILDGKDINKPPQIKNAVFNWNDFLEKNPELDLNFNLKDFQSNFKIEYGILGDKIKKIDFVSNTSFFDYDNLEDLDLKDSDLEKYNFIKVDHNEKKININGDKLYIYETLVFPSKYLSIINPGTNIVLKNNASLIFKSNVKFTGTEKNKIFITSDINSKSGILILNAKKHSFIKNTIFKYLSTPVYKNINLTGSINFYNSNIEIIDSNFIANFRSDDMINIIRSKFNIKNSIFINSNADAIDIDFSDGIISNTDIEYAGNDAIDFSGSEVDLNNINISRIGDKALSAGENSQISSNNISISESKYGIVSKDLSVISANEIFFSNVNSIALAFQKKNEYGPAEIFLSKFSNSNDNNNFIVDKFSSITLDKKIVIKNYNSELVNLIYE